MAETQWPGGLLNFAVVAESRSGASMLHTALDRHDRVVCHAGLFQPDRQARAEAHRAYFGEFTGATASNPFDEKTASASQYLWAAVYDNPRRGERAVGVHLTYEEVTKWELYDMLESRYLEGDFCVIHVRRNPVACFVSAKQAAATGVVCRPHGSPTDEAVPEMIDVDPAELLSFCRRHAAVAGKVAAACKDILTLSYVDLCCRYRDSVRRAFKFLEVTQPESRPEPAYRRLANRPVRNRIYNWDSLVREAPSELAAYLHADDLL